MDFSFFTFAGIFSLSMSNFLILQKSNFVLVQENSDEIFQFLMSVHSQE